MASLNTKLPITELKAILEAMNFFAKVSVGKVEDLVTETTLPSIYITLDSDINENNGQMRTDGGEYNRILIVTLQIHLDQTTEDDLYYLDVRDKVESAILKDSLLWQSVIDRDVVGSRWDKGQNLPRKQGEMALRLFTRGCVV